MATISRKTVKSIALPAEHGGWSFWLEPVLLGMLVAPSWAGLGLIGLSLATFLMRQPLKIAMLDLRKRKVYTRTRVAVGFVALYSLMALLSLLAGLVASSPVILIPLIPAYAIAIAQLVIFDSRGDSRHWLPEVLGTAVMGAFAVSIALAGGWDVLTACGLWLIVVARSIPTVFYVRLRLRQMKGQTIDSRPVLILHLLALILISLCVYVRFVPLLTIPAMLVLLVRAFYYLRTGKMVPAKVIGLLEIVFGIVTVGLAALGYGLGL